MEEIPITDAALGELAPSPSRPRDSAVGAAPFFGGPTRRPGERLEPLRVEVMRDLAAFDALAAEWNALVMRVDDQLFYRHEFVRCWLTHFAPGSPLRVLAARDHTGGLVAVLGLKEEQGHQYGVPVRQLVSLTNKHSCRFDLLAEDPKRAAVAFLSHLLADPHWDVLRLSDVPDGGAAWAMVNAAQGAGMPWGAWPSARSPYLVLPPTVEAWKKGRSNAKPLRRRRRRLEEKGRVEVERVSGQAELKDRLEEAFSLEQSGWKAQQGTAIAQAEHRRGFYTSLAEMAAGHGWLGLYFLRLDSRPIAFQYGLQYGGRYLAMKPGYDEALSEVSPGHLLTENLVQDCIERGLTELDLLGDDAPYKREWTHQVRQHHWLFIYRDTLVGKTLQRSKFRWAPVAKRMVGRWVRRR
ncbi:GNAT family N-acetyltransferase [Corallococcus sicarius]|uniref:GNAT family N-acetyltransferase n=1 Tax=Corallococcus sicarius TaxID=2316726 RepID=A0A3A8NL90_9BACT|nr:GNAT family N-acetyltransferase [Corallococcus sicarius]RKH40214.1 GNAT family N-acetyltransferase [Corallococcus sicarius]